MNVFENIPHLEFNDLDGKKIKGIKQDGLLMVQADWCGHCIMAKPFFKELFDKFGKKFFIATVSSEEKKITALLNIRGFPTFFLIKNGVITEEANLKSRDLAGMKKAIGV